jgi:hypothetical protein
MFFADVSFDATDQCHQLGLTFFASAFFGTSSGFKAFSTGQTAPSRRNHEEDNYLRRRARGVYYPGTGGPVLGRPRLDLETLLDRNREAHNNHNDRRGACRVPNSDRSREFNENHEGLHVRLRVRLEPTEFLGPPFLAALI